MAGDKDPLDILDGLLARVQKAGGDAADAGLFKSVSLEVAQRLGASEKLERSESTDVGLRVFVGQRQAIVSSTDISDEALDAMVERAVAMAKVAPEDPYCGIADPDQIVTEAPALDIFDPSEPDTQSLIDIAIEAEDAARSVPGVTNSEGAQVGWGWVSVAMAASNGFAQSYSRSGSSYSASVLAGEGTEMERDYDYATAVYFDDLPSPATIGKNAGERAVRRLGARKMKTAAVPVIYDPRVSGGLVRHLTGAINGASVARGTSFLKESMGEAIFSPGIQIMEDPLRPRGLASKPFDGEGLPTEAKPLIDDGKLVTWVLDLASARQLGLASTGNASPEELIADITAGFYVTELIGMGVNGITGDYSRGASGFWIENGEITFAVSEMTIASNLKDMFKAMIPANDLVFRFGTDAPTIRIDGMTVAGM
jgi:PmbA protein